jgi:hypothetical protein
MKTIPHGFLKYAIVQKRLKKSCFILLLVLATVAVTFNIAFSKANYTAFFNVTYGTFGTDRGDSMGSCITCHNLPDGKGKYNPYGTEWKNYGRNFAGIEPLDSDNDGFSNIEEINAGSFPGDPGSTPGTASNPGPDPGTPPAPDPGTPPAPDPGGSAPANHRPIASAGPNQAVNDSTQVTLDGSNSMDADGDALTYSWVQTGGPQVALSDDFVERPSFTAPFVMPGGEAVPVTFQLTVSDGFDQSTSKCIVYVFPSSAYPMMTVTGEPLALQPDAGAGILSLKAVDAPPDYQEVVVNLIYGLIDFKAEVTNTGDMAKIIVHLPGPAPKEARWYKYNTTDGYFDFSREVISNNLGDGAEFNADRTKVILYITDNGPYDDDKNDLIIADPSGLGIASTSSSTSSGLTPGGDFGGAGGGGGGCFIATLANGTEGGGFIIFVSFLLVSSRIVLVLSRKIRARGHSV